jgi:hypothetical protein
LAAGQGNAAAAEFQKILDHVGIVWNCWTGALAHLGVARANDKGRKYSGRALSARTSSQPIQCRHCVISVPQPGSDFSSLKQPIPGAKIVIEQLRDFFSRAWLPDLI